LGATRGRRLRIQQLAVVCAVRAFCQACTREGREGRTQLGSKPARARPHAASRLRSACEGHTTGCVWASIARPFWPKVPASALLTRHDLHAATALTLPATSGFQGHDTANLEANGIQQQPRRKPFYPQLRTTQPSSRSQAHHRSECAPMHTHAKVPFKQYRAQPPEGNDDGTRNTTAAARPLRRHGASFSQARS
jgi:hypothetical protein